MDTAKVKNIIILVLLLVNLCLLALVAYDRIEAAGLLRQAEEDVTAAFESNGIRLASDVPWRANEPAFGLSRDREKEHSMVRRIIGRCAVQDLGGNILFYKGARGEARFRGTGEFQIMPTDGGIETGSDPIATASDVLRDMGFKVDASQSEMLQEGQAITVTLTCRFRGETAYNCKVKFLFSTENLLLIDGRRPLEKGESSEAEMLDAATVLMRFLAQAREAGLVCTEVRSVELGYLMEASAAGEGNMTPYWRIETDIGQHYINGVTGESGSLA